MVKMITLLVRPGNRLRNDDLNLRALEGCQPFYQRRFVIRARHDREAGGAAPDRELAIPATDIVARAGQSLAAAPVAIPADAADHRLLERGGVVPAGRRQMPGRALERLLETEPSVADRDHHDAPPEALRPAIALHRDPTALAGMLENVLADLG